MLFRVLLIAFIFLLPVFGLLLTGAVALNLNRNQAEILMTAPENCTGICLLGIHPGKSTVIESMNILLNHTWVDDVRQNAPGNGYAQINWGWSGKQPALIDDTKRGRITFYYSSEDMPGAKVNDLIIQTVTVYTNIPIYSFQQWFGETDIGNVNNRLDGTLGYTVYYDAPGGIINLTAEMICPVTIASYWQAKTRMTVSIGNSRDPYISPSSMIRLC